MVPTAKWQQSHEQMIEVIMRQHFGQPPKFVKRIAIGICNEVYHVGLENSEVIARLSPYDRFLKGSHDHIPKFKTLGIRVPVILAESYRKNLIPLSYQILSKIEGQDLGQVIESLSDKQLKDLAKEIANIFNKVSTLPASDKFGVIWGGGDDEISDTWTERMKIWIEDSKQRGLEPDVAAIADNLYEQYKSYFISIKPTTYYGDISSKNVMIFDGTFSGLVDLDGLTQGDPLEAIGRIKRSWYGTHHGEVYTHAVMDELRLTPEQRQLVTMYALLNQIAQSCENDIQFNQNTKAAADSEKANARKIIKMLSDDLELK